MLRLPKALRIGGRLWGVVVRPLAYMAGAAGYCVFDKARLELAPGQSEFDKRDSLLHETFHAILYAQGKTTFGNAEEELYVRSLATGLMAVLQDNPEFAKWLIHPISPQDPT